MEESKKKRLRFSDAWREARELVVAHRWRLALGGGLMLINRLVGLVLPASSKYIIDEVIGKGRAELLTPIALAAGFATLVQAITSFALSQVFGTSTSSQTITSARAPVTLAYNPLPRTEGSRDTRLRFTVKESEAH